MGLETAWKKWAGRAGRSKGRVCFFCLLSLMLFGAGKLKCQDISSTRFFNFDFQTLGAPQQLLPGKGGLVLPQAYEPSHLIRAELKFPIKLKGATKVFGELQYNNEYVYGIVAPFDDDGVAPIKLHQSSLSFIVSHKFQNGYRLLNKVGLGSSSDRFFNLGNNALSWCNSTLIQREFAGGKFGLGASLGYDKPSGLSIMPLVLYQKQLPRNWELDLLIPAKALLIKNTSSSSRFYMGIKGSNASYYLSNPSLANNTGLANVSGLNYRRLNSNAILGYEIMATPLVGLGIEAGATIPLESGIYRMENRWQEVHNFGQKVSPYFNFRVFFAIPRR